MKPKKNRAIGSLDIKVGYSDDTVKIQLTDIQDKCRDQNDADSAEMVSLLQSCLNPKTSLLAEYMKVLSQVGSQLKKCCEVALNNDRYDDIIIYIRALAEIHAMATRIPVRRMISSTLQNLPERYHSIVKEEFAACLLKYLNKASSSDLELHLHILDLIASYLENWTLGETTLTSVNKQVLVHMSTSLTTFVKACCETESTSELTDLAQSCHVIMKTLITVIQKCFMREQSAGFGSEHIETVTTLLKAVSRVMQQSTFTTNCHSVAGMTLIALLKLTCNSSNIVSLITKCILPSTTDDSTNVNECPSELQGLLLEAGLTWSKLCRYCQLCICHGILAMLDVNSLISVVYSHTTLLDVLFMEIMKLQNSLVDSYSILAASRTITLWTQTIKQSLDKLPPESTLKHSMSGHGCYSQRILDYVWENWEHAIEGMRYQMKIIFENIIEIHLLVVGKDCDIAMNGFIMDLFHQLMAHSWHVRSKYSFLVTMVTYLGSETILKLHPTMPSDVLEAMEEQTTAPYASELYEKLLMSHKQQISDKPSKTESANQQNWQEVWLPPLLKILNSKRKSSALIVQYLLPRLLKNSPDCLDYIVSYLQSSQQTHLSALITCLKVARSQGLLRKKEDCDTDTWLGVIPVSLLKQAVCHQDNQALSLLCDSAKTTEVFNTVDFDLIKLFIKCNMKNQSAASRHCMMSDFKKVLLRIQEGGVVLWRQRDKEAAKTYLRQYKEFLEWLCDYSFSSLHPDACYPKRTTALGILTLLGNIYSVGTSHDKKGGVEFCFTNQWSPAHLQTVLECLTDSYVGNREMAYQLLISAPNIAQKVIHLYSIGLELANGSKPQDSVIAANLLGLVCESGAMTTEQVILDLLNSLQDHINTAKSSLLHAAANEPMYGLLYCIRTILKNKHGHIATSAIKNSMETILQLCFDAAGVVSPVVCNTSPEGYLPVNDGKDASVSLECLVFKDPVEERETKQQDDTPRVTTVTPQMVLVCCWVTMKEVSLLLGQLTQMSLDRCSLLTAQQMRNIGEFFMDLLLQARHRGAFELSYTGFEQLCSKLWRNTDKTLNKLPRQWLQTLLQEIRSASPDSQLCATRRSAGIPFAFQAILNAEPVISSERHCFREVMEQLLQLARGETITDCTFTPQVHALNILCAMYRDSKLGEDVFPFIAEGIQVAVPGFDSQIWSVRNSCMMLLNALVTRTFGVKRSKDEHSKKNQMSGREFFSRFPTLYGFLLEQIKIVTQQINNLQPSQFAVLLILSRLYSSTFDGVDSNQSSADFIPYIQQCGKSSVWKTRIMAARVLSSLTPTNRMVSMVTDLIDSLPKYVNDMTSTQNTIHGTLLQLHYLLQRYQHDHRLPDNIQEELINESLPRLQNCIWLATRDNRCNITRAAYLELIDCYILTSHQVQPHAKLTDFKQVISSTIKDEISHNPLPSHSPGCVQVEEVIAKISWKIYTAENHTDINWLSNSLTSQFYEVRLLSLNNLVELLQASSDRSDCDGLCRMCQDRNLFQLLVKMMKTEKHPDCLAQVFEALLYHNDTLVFPWATDSEELICLQVLSFLLGKLEESMNIARSDLPSSLVKLMSKFIPVIYDELTQYSSKDQHFAIFKEWINSMEMTTSIEQTTGLRLTCAHTIVNVSKCVLEDPVSVLGDAPLLLWKSVITLLQEEEEEIRQAVTPAVTASLGFGFGFKDMKSSIALTQLFDTVVSQHGKRHWETVFSFLLSYMVEDESLEDINYDEDTDGERLYDKGEANSYAERTEIIQLAASTLTKWLTEYPPLELKHVQCIQKYRTKVVNSLREFSSTLTVNTCCPFQNTSVYKHSCVVLYSLLKSVSAISLLPMTDQDMMNLKTIAKNMSSFPAVTQGTGKNYYISEILDDFTEKLKLSI